MQRLQFEGNGLEYFKIWIVNILLIVVTLGLYYPWAKVRNRRYFYANSTLNGRNFEYHATGKQLFFGYLIAMLLFITYVIIQEFSPIGSAVVILIFFLAFPWIIWRSLKFNLRMTSFSNVRFSFEGLLGGAYFNYMFLRVALVLILAVSPIALAISIPIFGDKITPVIGACMGIALIAALVLAFYFSAFMQKKNISYVVGGYRFGQGQFIIEVETKKFALIAAKAIGLGMLIMVASALLSSLLVFLTIGFGELFGMLTDINDPEKMAEVFSGGLLLTIIPAYLSLLVAGMVLGAYIYCRQRTYIFANSSLEENITFASTLKARSLTWVWITNILAVAFSLGLATPWAKVRAMRLLLENTEVQTDTGFDQFITEKQKEQSSLGEQIGDAFDVEVGIGI